MLKVTNYVRGKKSDFSKNRLLDSQYGLALTTVLNLSSNEIVSEKLCLSLLDTFCLSER